MDVSMAMMTSLVMPNFVAICPLAGAIMLDERGERKVNIATTDVCDPRGQGTRRGQTESADWDNPLRLL